MDGKYFKARDRFDFKPNKYEIGTPIFIRKTHLDMDFLNKTVSLNEEEHSQLYEFHLNYYLKKEPDSEKEFLEELFDLVQTYLNLEKHKNTLKMTSKGKYKSDQRIKKYKAFIKMLESKDKWAVTSKLKKDIIYIKPSARFHIANFALWISISFAILYIFMGFLKLRIQNESNIRQEIFQEIQSNGSIIVNEKEFSENVKLLEAFEAWLKTRPTVKNDFYNFKKELDTHK